MNIEFSIPKKVVSLEDYKKFKGKNSLKESIRFESNLITRERYLKLNESPQQDLIKAEEKKILSQGGKVLKKDELGGKITYVIKGVTYTKNVDTGKVTKDEKMIGKFIVPNKKPEQISGTFHSVVK